MSNNVDSLRLSIVLPVLNEAGNLPGLIQEITNHMRALVWEYEIILINDGSTDGSKEIIEGLRKSDDHIRTVHHPKNRGYGAALRSGFSAATKEWLFFMDSDRQFDIKEISQLAEHLHEADLIIGYRERRQDHFIRRLNAAIFNFTVNALFNLWVKDIDCAFKLMKREVADRAHLESNGALINTELLVRAKKLGYRIKQVPVSHYPRLSGKQSGANIRVILRAMKEILLFRLTGRTVSH